MCAKLRSVEYFPRYRRFNLKIQENGNNGGHIGFFQNMKYSL